MDLFNRNNINECTKTDFLDTNIHRDSKDHAKEKKILHKLARSRLKQQLKKEYDKDIIDKQRSINNEI